MDTYRNHARTHATPRPRPWWDRIPPRVRTIAVTTLFVGLFIAASWGDGPYEPPKRLDPPPVQNPGPWSWWDP